MVMRVIWVDEKELTVKSQRDENDVIQPSFMESECMNLDGIGERAACTSSKAAPQTPRAEQERY
jgi:hypothetical protein